MAIPKTKKHALPFKIVNNILIGEEDPIDEDVDIGNLILSTFESKLDFIGQIDAATGERITFREMKEKSIKLASYLIHEGYGKGTRITICTNNQMLAYLPFLAGLYIGGVINPWNINCIEDSIRIMSFLIENDPQIIFIDEHGINAFNEDILMIQRNTTKTIDPKIIVFENSATWESIDEILDDTYYTPEEIDDFFCEATCGAMDVAVSTICLNTIRYPCMAKIPYIAFTNPYQQAPPVMHPNDIALWYGDLSSSHNLLLTIRAILSYVTVVKCSMFDEEDMYQVMEEYKVTWVFLESSMCNKLMQTYLLLNTYDVSSLKSLVFGDTAIQRQIHKDLITFLPNVSVVQIYSTSTTGVIAYQRNSSKIGSSGNVNKNIRVKVIDTMTGKEVGPNVAGEIWCKAPCAIIPFEYNCKRKSVNWNRRFKGWYNTTDIGYYDKDGDIFIIDKDRNIIKYKNELVSATTIEETLQSHPDVQEVAVVPVPVSNEGQYPRAYVKKMSNAQVTKEKLIQFVADNLPDSHKLRAGLYFVECEKPRLPRLPNGQLDKIRIKCMPHEEEEEEDDNNRNKMKL